MCHFEKCMGHNGTASFPTTLKDKLNGYVPNFYLKHWSNTGKSCVFCNNHATGSFSRVCKKECSPHTHTNISFEQLIPMSQRLVTSEASVLCFICVYSFPVCASSFVSAETSSAGESISRLTPVFQIIAWNEIKCLSNLQIWCSNHSSW